MDLSLFFDPLGEQLQEIISSHEGFGRSFYCYDHQVPDLEGIHLAIVGLMESRGADTQSSGLSEAADNIRKHLYTLQRGSATYKVADLGNLRNGPTHDDTIHRVKEICSYLLSKEIVPIFIGSSHDMTLGQFGGYDNQEEPVNLMVLDSIFDAESEGSASRSHLRSLVAGKTRQPFQITHLAHQAYLMAEEAMNFMSSLNFEAIRLGAIKENVKDMEPLVRDADLVSFDLSSLNQQFAPGAVGVKPFGLTGEEACQLSWYAGLNNKLTSIGFYELDSDLDDERGTTAFVVATMIWYFIEGFYHRVGDLDFRSDNFLVYEVSMTGEPSSIRFFKSKRSEKWWMEVPLDNSSSVFLRNKMIPCNYSDYESALTGEVPSRWLSAFAHLN